MAESGREASPLTWLVSRLSPNEHDPLFSPRTVCINHRCCLEHLTRTINMGRAWSRTMTSLTLRLGRIWGSMRIYRCARELIPHLTSSTWCYLVANSTSSHLGRVIVLESIVVVILFFSFQQNRHHVDQRLHPVLGCDDVVDGSVQHITHQVPGMSS